MLCLCMNMIYLDNLIHSIHIYVRNVLVHVFKVFMRVWCVLQTEKRSTSPVKKGTPSPAAPSQKSQKGYIYTYNYTKLHMYIYTHIYLYIYKYIHLYKYIYMYLYIYTYINIQILMFVYAYIYRYIQAHMILPCFNTQMYALNKYSPVFMNEQER